MFEFKYNSEARRSLWRRRGTPKKALDQIIQKNYALKYARFKKPTTLVGIAFNDKRKEFSLNWIAKEHKKTT